VLSNLDQVLLLLLLGQHELLLLLYHEDALGVLELDGAGLLLLQQLHLDARLAQHVQLLITLVHMEIINRLLEMMSDALTNARKKMLRKTACARCQQYKNNSVFSLVQMTQYKVKVGLTNGFSIH